MAASFERTFIQDLNERLDVHYRPEIVFSNNNLSNVIHVRLYRGTAAYSEGGTVSATCIRSDGKTVPILNGTISGNVVTVSLIKACMIVPGPIQVFINLSSGDVNTTIFKGVFSAEPSETDAVIDPGDVISGISDLINTINEAVESIPADHSQILAAIAPTFSDSETYDAGSYVWYGGILYRFVADHSAGSWSSSQVVRAEATNNLADDISAIESAADFAKAGIEENVFEFKKAESVTAGGVTYTTGTDGCITLDGTASGSYFRCVTPDGGVGNMASAKIFTLHKGITYRLKWELVSGTFTGSSSIPIVRVHKRSDSSVLLTAFISQQDREFTYTPTDDVDVVLAVYSVNSRVYSNYKIKPFFAVRQDFVVNVDTRLDTIKGDMDAELDSIRNELGINPDVFKFRRANSVNVNGVTYTSNIDGTISLNGTASASSYRTIASDGKVDNLENKAVFTLEAGKTYRLWFDYVSGSFTGATGVPMIRLLKASDGSILLTANVSESGVYKYYTPEADIDVALSVWATNSRAYTHYVIAPHFAEIGIYVTPARKEPHVTLSLFERVALIGDSFSSGSTAYNHNKLNYPISWLQQMARRFGFAGTNYSAGGLTSYTWLYVSSKGKRLFDEDSWKQLYFIALGINDSNPNTDTSKTPLNVPVGTIADFNNPSYAPATGTTGTFYGNMGTIYRAIKVKNSAAIVCYVTIPRFDVSGGTVRYTPYDTAIKAIASATNSLLIDCSKIPLFRTRWWLNNLVTAHPTAPMYSAMANALAEAFEQAALDGYDALYNYNGFLNDDPDASSGGDSIGE